MQREIGVPHGICGQAFVDGRFFLVTTDDEESGDYWLTRVDARGATPVSEDIARIPFAARALAFDGERFWTNHRAADQIVANPGTITGSIGVIIQWVNYGDLLEWAKLRTVTIKSGSLKDAGNPSRALTDEERKYFEDLIQKLRAQFQNAVAEGRKGRLKPDALERMSDGRVVTGEEALALGLVDEIGDYRDAVDRAARLAHLSLPAEVWRPRLTRPGLIELLTGPSESTWTGRLLSGAPVGGGWNVFFLW